jgi:hypothetical protein
MYELTNSYMNIKLTSISTLSSKFAVSINNID